MKYTSRHKSMGLTRRDFSIVKRILDTDKRSFDISKETNIPRATVLFRLKKLEDRSLVEKNGSRPDITWKSTQNLKDLLAENTGNSGQILGIKNIECAFLDFFLKAANKKIYFIENTTHIKNVRKKFSEDYFSKLRNSKTIEKVIQEGVTSESSLSFLKGIKDISKNKNKMISWTIVPDDHLVSEDSFFVLEDTVLIVNLEKETLVKINNNSLSKLVINQMKILSKFGKKIGFSDFIERVEL